jgi:hypothetical protein
MTPPATLESELRALAAGPQRDETLRMVERAFGVTLAIPFQEKYARARVVRLILREHREATGRRAWSYDRIIEVIASKESKLGLSASTAKNIVSGSDKDARIEGQRLYDMMMPDEREQMHTEWIELSAD